MNNSFNPTYHGQSYLDEIIHKTFFNNKINGFFVECGAFDGYQESSCKFFEDNLGWTGLNIEPVPYLFDQLVLNRPNSINENVAISSENGKSVFTQAIHPTLGRNFGNGSLSYSDTHLQELKKQNCEFETFDVDVVSFAELYKKYLFPKIDLFVLDVEGHEEKALQGILSIPHSVLPRIFCIEYSIVGEDKISKLMKSDYKYIFKHFQNAFYAKKYE
jgi:FkbM family methyltransferase